MTEWKWVIKNNNYNSNIKFIIKYLLFENKLLKIAIYKSNSYLSHVYKMRMSMNLPSLFLLLSLAIVASRAALDPTKVVIAIDCGSMNPVKAKSGINYHEVVGPNQPCSRTSQTSLMPPIDRSQRDLSIGGIRLVWEVPEHT